MRENANATRQLHYNLHWFIPYERFSKLAALLHQCYAAMTDEFAAA